MVGEVQTINGRIYRERRDGKLESHICPAHSAGHPGCYAVAHQRELARSGKYKKVTQYQGWVTITGGAQ